VGVAPGVGLDGTGATVNGSASGLTFLGRPLGRRGLSPSVDAGDGSGVVGSTGADVGSSVVKASGRAS
jgi:hypothetical protein